MKLERLDKAAVKRGEKYAQELEEFLVREKGIKIEHKQWIALPNYKRAWEAYESMILQRNKPIIRERDIISAQSKKNEHEDKKTPQRDSRGDDKQQHQSPTTDESKQASRDTADRLSSGGGDSIEELSF